MTSFVTFPTWDGLTFKTITLKSFQTLHSTVAPASLGCKSKHSQSYNCPWNGSQFNRFFLEQGFIGQQHRSIDGDPFRGQPSHIATVSPRQRLELHRRRNIWSHSKHRILVTITINEFEVTRHMLRHIFSPHSTLQNNFLTSIPVGGDFEALSITGSGQSLDLRNNRITRVPTNAFKSLSIGDGWL